MTGAFGLDSEVLGHSHLLMSVAHSIPGGVDDGRKLAPIVDPSGVAPVVGFGGSVNDVVDPRQSCILQNSRHYGGLDGVF